MEGGSGASLLPPSTNFNFLIYVFGPGRRARPPKNIIKKVRIVSSCRYYTQDPSEDSITVIRMNLLDPRYNYMQISTSYP